MGKAVYSALILWSNGTALSLDGDQFGHCEQIHHKFERRGGCGAAASSVILLNTPPRRILGRKGDSEADAPVWYFGTALRLVPQNVPTDGNCDTLSNMSTRQLVTRFGSPLL